MQIPYSLINLLNDVHVLYDAHADFLIAAQSVNVIISYNFLKTETQNLFTKHFLEE